MANHVVDYIGLYNRGPKINQPPPTSPPISYARGTDLPNASAHQFDCDDVEEYRLHTRIYEYLLVAEDKQPNGLFTIQSIYSTGLQGYSSYTLNI